MTRITFIGAGSIGFTRTLVRDILTFPRLADAELVLMDIDAERLEFAERSVRRIIELGNYPATVKTTLSRAEALQGADVVMVTILAGGVHVWRHDIEIPKQFGIDINVGDTRGPSRGRVVGTADLQHIAATTLAHYAQRAECFREETREHDPPGCPVPDLRFPDSCI